MLSSGVLIFYLITQPVLTNLYIKINTSAWEHMLMHAHGSERKKCQKVMRMGGGASLWCALHFRGKELGLPGNIFVVVGLLLSIQIISYTQNVHNFSFLPPSLLQKPSVVGRDLSA